MPGADMVCGQGLMAVQPRDAALFKNLADGCGPGQAGGRIVRLCGCKQPVAGNLLPQLFRRQQGGDIFSNRHGVAT